MAWHKLFLDKTSTIARPQAAGRHDLILFVAAALQKTEPKMISEDFTFTQKRPFCFVVAIFLGETPAKSAGEGIAT